MLTCLANSQHPDLTSLHSPELVWQLDLEYHAGMVVVSEEKAACDRILDRYQEWLSQNVLAVPVSGRTYGHGHASRLWKPDA